MFSVLTTVCPLLATGFTRSTCEFRSVVTLTSVDEAAKMKVLIISRGASVLRSAHWHPSPFASVGSESPRCVQMIDKGLLRLELRLYGQYNVICRPWIVPPPPPPRVRVPCAPPLSKSKTATLRPAGLLGGEASMSVGLNLVVPKRNLGFRPPSDSDKADASHHGDGFRRE
jgi:hypothetical protein